VTFAPRFPTSTTFGATLPAVDVIGDRPRYLAPSAGYTADVAAAIDKLEAIDAAEQERQTANAHRRWQAERRKRWGEAAQTINGAMDEFSNGAIDRRLASDLRAIRRSTECVSRRLDDEYHLEASA
jgi:hypothetical protein